jgi:hypothetical protein
MILHCNASLGARPDSAWPPTRQRNLPKARRVGFFLGICAASDWIEVLRGIIGSHTAGAVVGSASERSAVGSASERATVGSASERAIVGSAAR